MATNLDARWELIQDTRKRNPRTREPVPGALGLAYMISRIKNTVEKVAVLSKSREGKILVQRATGGQILEVALTDLRTESELWNAAKTVAADKLPKTIGSVANGTRWDPSRQLSKTVLMKVWEASQ